MKLLLVVDAAWGEYAIGDPNLTDEIDGRKAKGRHLSYEIYDAANKKATESYANKKYPEHFYVSMKGLLTDPPWPKAPPIAG